MLFRSQRTSDAFLSFPPLVLPIVIAIALGGSLNSVMIGIAISWFPWYVRIARAQAITIKSSDYVLISKSMGASFYHIVRKHVLPNSVSPVIVQASIDAGYAILTVAGLSFIGLGAEPPSSEWGLLITASRAQFLYHWCVIWSEIGLRKKCFLRSKMHVLRVFFQMNGV